MKEAKCIARFSIGSAEKLSRCFQKLESPNDIGRDEILEMVFELRIPDAVVLLRDAYPVEAPDIRDFDLTEPGALSAGHGPDYASIRTDYIDAIERAYEMSLRISTAIALHFGAHG